VRRRLIPIMIAAAVIAAAAVAVIAARDDGGSTGDTTSSPFPTRTAKAGEVTVEATLIRLDTEGATSTVVFDTHSVELDLDVATGATLTVGGTAWPTQGWDGDGPGGHHREGELRFDPAGPVEGEATLTITGLAEPVTFRWPARPA